ncbi:MAG: tRNA pseudouridine(38-40) synthase TruA [Paludibacteraceae bacterium]|nr:tRNA pseudouridine(38-40) synthase TruA [Paludibacteraceae bacterium]
MSRFFVKFSYNGAAYHGWQKQPNGVTVQEVLDRALSIVAGEEISTTGAGRTDAGVHAKTMYAHFDASSWCPDDNSVYRLNRILPPDICVYDLRQVADDANARFDAKSRTYEYWLSTKKNPFLLGLADFEFFDFDFEAMNEAASKLLTFTDFTSFSKLHTDVKTNNCRVTKAEWTCRGDGLYVFTITADRFLRNMVRAIVGTLFVVGRRKMTPQQFCEIIEAKDRCKAGTSAPAEGLYLVDVKYDYL